MKKIRLRKDAADELFFSIKGYLGTGYWLGKREYVLWRAVMPKEIKTLLEQGRDFVYRNGKATTDSDDFPDIVHILSQGITPPSLENKLEETDVLIRSYTLDCIRDCRYVRRRREEFSPSMLFIHPTGRLVPVGYQYLPLFDGLDLYQSEEDTAISGYDAGGAIQFIVMPIRAESITGKIDEIRQWLGRKRG